MVWAVLGVILAACFIFAAFIAFFSRSPARQIPSSKTIVSPADGKVTDIIDLLNLKKHFFKFDTDRRIKEIAKDAAKTGYMIVISTGMLDVHNQRAPADGKILYASKRKGKHRKAKGIKSIHNEMEEILMKTAVGKIKVCLVSGMLSGKTEAYVKKGDKILKGQHIGRAGMGSHAVMIMPDYPLEVKKGSRVFAGETIIAHYGDGM